MPLMPAAVVEEAGVGALTLIAEIDLTAVQTFTAIPGTYSDLRVVIVGRGTRQRRPWFLVCGSTTTPARTTSRT